MDDLDITMEEYIQIEAEKERRHGQEFNWETATYGKVRYFEDIDYFKDFENGFSAIVYKDALASKREVLYEPTLVVVVVIYFYHKLEFVNIGSLLKHVLCILIINSGLWYLCRLSIKIVGLGIPPGQGILGESTSSKFHFAVLGVSLGLFLFGLSVLAMVAACASRAAATLSATSYRMAA
ncbi:hypothetical protein Tco_0632405 [Tanacetum coccineum]